MRRIPPIRSIGLGSCAAVHSTCSGSIALAVCTSSSQVRIADPRRSNIYLRPWLGPSKRRISPY
ncbi:hypothetical protein PF011_g31100 [Phytophthora fragariae]|uniref:Uncharacterized protein n=1 Tax=Phytophthora fragariae TaxID=53985 RepID=A0A6A3GJL6_9STRA|nr:hypothetical protein PF011_g31100 [Phytophthora fragariae]